VLLDYLLPDADGLEFLEQLADRNDRDAPPVVMLTGQGSESIAVRAIKLGAQDYLVKRDLTPELLQLTIRQSSCYPTHLPSHQLDTHRIFGQIPIVPDNSYLLLLISIFLSETF
jgi:DNA-binding response OmpR family regulator